MFWTYFLAIAVLLGLSIIGLAIRMLLVKGGKFPNTHIEHNPNMEKLGIHCALHDDDLCQGLPDREKPKKTCSGKGLEECRDCAFFKV